jgi:lipopolysaccharide export system permease protein
MRTLDLYIGRQVLAAMALVLLVLGGLDLLFTIVDELGNTNERYQSFAAIKYVLLIYPRHLYELLPMSALIGALAGLGMLATGNELVVMQVSGVSVRRIVVAVMKPALLVMVLGLVLGEYVAPQLELRAEVGRALASGQEVGLSRFGHWERDGAAFIHFNGIEPEGILHGVSMLVFDEKKRVIRSVEAARAIYVLDAAAQQDSFETSGGVQLERLATEVDTADSAGSASGYWLLENGREIVFIHDTDGNDSIQSEQSEFAAQHWDLDLTPDLLQVLIIDPDVMAMTDLYTYAQRFERQGQNADTYYLSFWKKLLQPLATAILVLVAISFIFGPLREATMGSRVFTAICFGLAFTILQRLIHNMGLVYQLPPLLAVLAPLVLSAALGLFMFRRTT